MEEQRRRRHARHDVRNEIATGLQHQRDLFALDAERTPSFGEMQEHITVASSGCMSITAQTIADYHNAGGSNPLVVWWLADFYECDIADISETCARHWDALHQRDQRRSTTTWSHKRAGRHALARTG